MDFATENFVGPYVIEFLLSIGTPGGIADVAYLERLKSFTQWLKTQDEVVLVTGLTDTIKRLNRPIHSDDPDWYRLPDSRETDSISVAEFSVLALSVFALNVQLGVLVAITLEHVVARFLPAPSTRHLARPTNSLHLQNLPGISIQRGNVDEWICLALAFFVGDFKYIGEKGAHLFVSKG